MNQMNIEECREMSLKLGMNRFKVDEWYGYASKNAATTFLALIESTIYERIKDQRLMGKLDVYTVVGLSTVVQNITNGVSI